MKYLFYIIILVIFNFEKSFSQDKDMIIFGNQIFESVRDIDTIKFHKLMPEKDDLLGFVGSSSASNMEKQEFINKVVDGFPKYKDRMFRKLKLANEQGKNAGINWNKAVYETTEIEDNSSIKTTIKPINIAIKFSYYNAIYILRTKLVYYKKYYIVEKVVFEMI